MDKKLPTYEDYFRVAPNLASDQTQSTLALETGPELHQAASLLIEKVVSVVGAAQNFHPEGNSMSNWPNEQRGMMNPRTAPNWSNEQREMMYPQTVSNWPNEQRETMYPQTVSDWPNERRRMMNPHVPNWSNEQYDYEYQYGMMNPRTDEGRYIENQYHEYDHYRRRAYNEGPERYESYREFNMGYWESSEGGMRAEARMQRNRYNREAARMDQGGKNSKKEDSEENTTFCKLCNMTFDNPQKYFSHTRGMLHKNRQKAANVEQQTGNRQKPEYLPPFDKGGPQQEKQLEQESQQRCSQNVNPETVSAMDQDVDKKEEEEEDDDEEEDTSYCKLCDVRFDDDQKYFRHTRGLMHTQRQMEADKAKQGTTQEDKKHDQGPENQPQEKDSLPHPPQTKDPETDVAMADDEDDYMEEDWEDNNDEDPNVSKNDEDPKVLICELCDIRTTGITAMRAHQSGRSHKTVQEAVDNGTPLPQRIFSRLGPKANIPANLRPSTASLDMKPSDGPSVLLQLLKSIPEGIVGTEFVKEGRVAKQPTFFCTVCDCRCDAAGIQSHIIGSKHRMKYLRDHQPTIYEHVKSHGGKKSQLTTFLEEVCTDIEKREGRKEPIMEKSEGDTGTEDKEKKSEKKKDSEKTTVEKKASDEEKSDKKDEQKKDQEVDKEQEKPAKEEKKQGTGPKMRHLPHDVVTARYREAKMKTEEGCGPMEPHEGEGWGGPVEPFIYGQRRDAHGPDYGPDYGPVGPRRGGFDPRFGPVGPRMGGPGPLGPERGRPGPDSGPMDPGMDGPGPHFGPVDYMMDRDPLYEFPRRPDPFPNFMEFPAPLPYMSEEERRDRMFEYERHLFYQPMLDISPEEARRLMFLEYERLGIPYEIACSRVRIQEERLEQLAEYLKGGMALRDAQARLVTMENRKRLVKEYELSGLDVREAQWRVIVEEERNRLFADYEEKGFTPLQARAKIMAGDARTRLIQEFERNGMSSEEAYRRAIAEEDRLKNLEASLKRGLREYDNASSREQALDDIANKRMLENYMENGDTREQAENKVIAVLRRQGVSTQEAILQVQKIKVEVPEKSEKHNKEQKQDYGQERTEPKTSENFDSFTPEEAKERLFQEYEKRGVPREKARLVLIQELIRSGVPQEEAKQRFSDTRPIKVAKRERESRQERGGRSRKYTGYDHSRSRSRSRSRSASSSLSNSLRRRRSPLKGDKKYSRLHKGYKDRSDVWDGRQRRQQETDVWDERQKRREDSDVRDDRHKRRGETDVWNNRQKRREEMNIRHDMQRRREEVLSYRKEDHSSRGTTSKDRGRRDEESKESITRPTLTLGEELKLKARKLKHAEFLSQLEEKSVPSKHTATVSQSAAQVQLPEGSGKEDTSDVSDLLKSLTDNLISSEDNESVALSMSKALTSALLKYRVSDGKEKPSGSTAESGFIQRRIDDAKKLFETKMQPQREKQSSSYGGSQGYGQQPSSSDLYVEVHGEVRPGNVGLPPSLPAYAGQAGQSTSMSSRPPENTSAWSGFKLQIPQKKKTTIPRVLLSSDSKEQSSRKLYHH